MYTYMYICVFISPVKMMKHDETILITCCFPFKTHHDSRRRGTSENGEIGRIWESPTGEILQDVHLTWWPLGI